MMGPSTNVRGQLVGLKLFNKVALKEWPALLIEIKFDLKVYRDEEGVHIQQ